MRLVQSLAIALLGLIAFADAAGAHHVVGGQTPATFTHGLLSGLGHPIIGLDHFAFVVAVGLIAALYRRPYILPGLFLAGMAGGVGVHLAALDIPFNELLIALSVVVLGGLAIRARALPVLVSCALFVAAGLFHGYAYGEAIVGAGPAPMIAYLVGLVAIQYAIAAGAIAVFRGVSSGVSAAGTGRIAQARIAGGAVFGVGLVFLVQNLTA